ncbi:3-oxoacyl-[acyl-carrier-] reductase domain protein [Mycobacterium ulcerans str. Harvey]|uniref:3-oxoacyl-[acyl-carrier-] reductase domain protein n=1 Tax=Mycobacterium ulcerans str. Harvey TaxID=1299332 RepID=A0ABP3A8D4_MYCUL|nr:3-oxoacyl-[acyl-carrier-] reductase domain protein [Mycobacterium ulcerans str. Harvey]
MGYADQLFDLTDHVVLITGAAAAWAGRWPLRRHAAAPMW